MTILLADQLSCGHCGSHSWLYVFKHPDSDLLFAKCSYCDNSEVISKDAYIGWVTAGTFDFKDFHCPMIDTEIAGKREQTIYSNEQFVKPEEALEWAQGMLPDIIARIRENYPDEYLETYELHIE